MPCPAKELGGIAPFVAMFVAISESQKSICSPRFARWRGCACSAFGHGMPYPTAGNGDCKRTTQALSRLRNSSAVATWGTVRNDCATEAFGIGRKLSPGLKVQVMFQASTCTFAPAVENYAPGTRQMLHLRSTVENGTGRRQFETNVLFRWLSLLCTSISTGSTASCAFLRSDRNF
jgi:hypothetical protein